MIQWKTLKFFQMMAEVAKPLFDERTGWIIYISAD